MADNWKARTSSWRICKDSQKYARELHQIFKMETPIQVEIVPTAIILSSVIMVLS